MVLDRVRDLESDRVERIEAAYKQATELARRGTDEQNELIATTKSFLQVVANMYAMSARSGESCGRFLANAVEGLPWAKAISVVGRDGRILCSSNVEASGLDISDRPHFQRALTFGSFELSDYALGRRLQGPMIFACYGALSANGTVNHVFAAVLDLDWIGRLARATAERSGSFVLMLDGGGTVLTHYPGSGKWIGLQFDDHPLVRQILNRSEGTVTGVGIDDVRRIFAFVQLPGTSTRLAVGIDENEVLRRVNEAMRRSYSQLGIIAGIVLISIWFGGARLFVRPIHNLAWTAKRLGQGELKARATEKPWAVEFVPLAAALDDMADHLAAREHYLRATNDRLEELAQNDSLTGLANRRTFDSRLKMEWKRAETLALLMIDIDYFKRLNDHYGHVAGDACLRSLGKIFAAAVRKDDLAARYGGEEFTLLLPGASLNAATKVAQRIRVAVENLRIAHVESPAGYVTVSIGVASLHPQSGIDPQVLVETADAGLYKAKSCGRNTVTTNSSVKLAATG
ncbi:MAG: diguanylate cyclase [Rhizobiales bacterium]|nr:diguanylate cyclase [Hyphomicrobiales bacterium]